ncbi:MAG: BMP family protein [Bacillota bacterium]
MKRCVVLALAMLLAVGMVTGCGGAKQPQRLRVAALLPGNITDQGWNFTAYNGLKRIEKELGAEVTWMEKVPPSDFEEVYRRYAQQGYHVIFGHGFQFGDPARKVAKDFPKTWFVVTSTTISQAPNVASLIPNAFQQGMLAGTITGLLSEKKVVGFVGGLQIPSIVNFAKWWEAGVKYIDPNIKILSAFTGSFYDAAKAKEQALAFINQGADIVIHNADQAGLGVIEACKERNIKTIGAIADQAHLAPEVIVNSVQADLTLAFEVIARKVMDKTIEAKHYNMGINDGPVALSGWKTWDSKIPQAVKDRMNQIVADLKSGKLTEATLPK